MFSILHVSQLQIFTFNKLGKYIKLPKQVKISKGNLNIKRVKVTLSSSLELRERFYSLERSLVLLDIGHVT